MKNDVSKSGKDIKKSQTGPVPCLADYSEDSVQHGGLSLQHTSSALTLYPSEEQQESLNVSKVDYGLEKFTKIYKTLL